MKDKYEYANNQNSIANFLVIYSINRMSYKKSQKFEVYWHPAKTFVFGRYFFIVKCRIVSLTLFIYVLFAVKVMIKVDKLQNVSSVLALSKTKHFQNGI
jgi:hypothetical protein